MAGWAGPDSPTDRPVGPTLKVGLTGGIGSGKSTVAAMLQRLGADLIDSDGIARELTQRGGPAIDAIRLAFGADFIDSNGGLDRSRMRALVFSDPRARHRLEAILHPLIGTEAMNRAARLHAPILVFDVPLLAESGQWRGRVHKVLVVDCSVDTQIERVATRPGWSRKTAQAVIGQQASRSVRLACADAVLHNESLSLQALQTQVRTLWCAWGATIPSSAPFP